jgi:hypothetical protein
MKPRLPIWVGLLHGAAQTLAPPDAAEEAARDAAMHSCEPYVVYVGGHRLLVVYDPPLESRKEESG